MPVTVGIATTGDEPRALRETVEGVIRSVSRVGDDAEVLVVVNGRDRVPELDGVDSPLLRVRYLDRRNVAVARNTVLEEARYDTILFTDDDCEVPVEWASQLVAALREPGVAAVGAPVRLNVTGPISAYADYLRAYDAVPAGPDGPLLLVTTNCGLRRDRIPASIRFDPQLNTAGEDTAFSLDLGKAGLKTTWLADATPIRHGFSENIEEITHRFMRNAWHGVHLYLGRGNAEAAIPGVLDLYRQRIQDHYRMDRRFAEFAEPEVRTAFAVYDALVAAVSAIGYLDRIGAELDHQLIRLDEAGFAAFAKQIAEKVREQTATLSTSDWAELRPDYLGMADRIGEAEPLLTEMRAALRTYARPTYVDPQGPVADVLNHGGGDLNVNFLEGLEPLRNAFDDVCATGAPTAHAIDMAVRGLGMSFKMALDAIETTLRFDFRRLVLAHRRHAVGKRSRYERAA